MRKTLFLNLGGGYRRLILFISFISIIISEYLCMILLCMEHVFYETLKKSGQHFR